VALEDMLSRSIDLSVFGWGSEVNSSIIRFHKGDILFGSMRPYFHKVGLAQFDGITRTTTFVLRPIEAAYRHFLLMHFASDAVVEFSTAASVGSTIPYIKRDVLGCYQIAVPPSSLAKQFDDLLRPVTTRLKANGQESRTLTDLRDTLLPKLISGEIRVPEAEVEVEAAV
jgi:type I restriction enzyme S subunit